MELNNQPPYPLPGPNSGEEQDLLKDIDGQLKKDNPPEPPKRKKIPWTCPICETEQSSEVELKTYGGHKAAEDGLACRKCGKFTAIYDIETGQVKENIMGNAEAQAEYDKLKGLLEALSAIGARKDKMLDGAEAALKGVGNTDALNNLERNLCGMRRTVLSELAGITKRFGG